MRPSLARQLNILVPIKRTIDYTVKPRLTSSGSIDGSVKHSMNPFDEIAVEEALRLRAKLKDGKDKVEKITAVSVGGAKSVETLRTALAMGAVSLGFFARGEGKEGSAAEGLADGMGMGYGRSPPFAGSPSPPLLLSTCPLCYANGTDALSQPRDPSPPLTLCSTGRRDPRLPPRRCALARTPRHRQTPLVHP